MSQLRACSANVEPWQPGNASWANMCPAGQAVPFAVCVFVRSATGAVSWQLSGTSQISRCFVILMFKLRILPGGSKTIADHQETFETSISTLVDGSSSCTHERAESSSSSSYCCTNIAICFMTGFRQAHEPKHSLKQQRESGEGKSDLPQQGSFAEAGVPGTVITWVHVA